jgi:hypothetical protein
MNSGISPSKAGSIGPYRKLLALAGWCCSVRITCEVIGDDITAISGRLAKYAAARA